MQKTRYVLFTLTLVVLLGNLLIKDINARKNDKMIKVSNDTNNKTCTEPLPPLQTRRTSTGRLITYRLNTWSQYENPEEIAHKREGDINEVSSRKTITRDVDLLWPNGVVRYFINDDIVNRSKQLFVLMRALRFIMQNTCIKFERILFHPKRMLNNWINITGSYQGCYCDLGRRPVGPTHMNLNVYQCFADVGHTIHEMMHALGVFHEHVRPDRDNYVTIIWENIQEDHKYNFDITTEADVTTYGFPYDYDSVMHYSMTAFSISRDLPTIIPKDSSVVIGQRDHISYYDIQKLLIAYNCNANSRMYNNTQLTRRNLSKNSSKTTSTKQ